MVWAYGLRLAEAHLGFQPAKHEEEDAEVAPLLELVLVLPECGPVLKSRLEVRTDHSAKTACGNEGSKSCKCVVHTAPSLSV